MRARINVEVAQEDRLRLDRIVGDRNSQQKHVARVLYEDGYCRPGQAENHIKSLKTHLAADRTSCTKATANRAPAVPSRRRLLDDVGSARLDAEAFDVAYRAVRHLTPAAQQARRAGRRNEDDDQDLSADILPGSRYFAPRAEAHPVSRRRSDGA